MTDLTNKSTATVYSPPEWKPPTNAKPFLSVIATAERANGIPEGLLVRLLYQESAYRPEVISGVVKSPVGAVGIAQVMPATAADPGFGAPVLRDSTDPYEAIPWSAKYLAGLYRYLGDWAQALAAYNWGAGYVRKTVDRYGDRWREYLPLETSNYVAQITRDVGGVA